MLFIKRMRVSRMRYRAGGKYGAFFLDSLEGNPRLNLLESEDLPSAVLRPSIPTFLYVTHEVAGVQLVETSRSFEPVTMEHRLFPSIDSISRK
jgi:hypothetical protein